MHYLAQIDLATLQANARQFYDETDFTWKPIPLADHGGDKYIGHYTNGQAVISGPLVVGNPNKTWFEIQADDAAVLDDIGAVEYGLMRDVLAGSAQMRALYKASILVAENSRRAVRNAAGNPIGATPDFVICGTNPEGSFLAGADPEDLPELSDLEN